jgi:hypothetical protein
MNARWLLLLTLLGGCSGDKPLGGGFSDDFDRAALGSDWRTTGPGAYLQDGKLVLARLHNHTVWLRRRLPADVKVELDCLSRSPDGDLKVELDGDGQGFQSDDDVAKDRIYVSTAYVFIFGGWRNSRSALVKENEHQWQFESRVPTRSQPRVEPGRTYHWVITRKGGHLDWSIDGQPFLSLDDPHPLSGAGHDHFGFNDWEAEVAFDNLRITPL